MPTTLELVELVEEMQKVKSKAHKLWVSAAEYKLDMNEGPIYGEGSSEAYILATINHMLGAMQPQLMMLVRGRVPKGAGPRRWAEVAAYVREKLS